MGRQDFLVIFKIPLLGPTVFMTGKCLHLCSFACSDRPQKQSILSTFCSVRTGNALSAIAVYLYAFPHKLFEKIQISITNYNYLLQLFSQYTVFVRYTPTEKDHNLKKKSIEVWRCSTFIKFRQRHIQGHMLKLQTMND